VSYYFTELYYTKNIIVKYFDKSIFYKRGYYENTNRTNNKKNII